MALNVFSSVVLGFSSKTSALGIGQLTKVEGFKHPPLRLGFTAHIHCVSSEAFCFGCEVLDFGTDDRMVEQSGGL